MDRIERICKRAEFAYARFVSGWNPRGSKRVRTGAANEERLTLRHHRARREGAADEEVGSGDLLQLGAVQPLETLAVRPHQPRPGPTQAGTVRRHCCGVVPWMILKHFEKCDEEMKPHAIAMSINGIRVPSINLLA